MSYRYMRLILMFDLPSVTVTDKKEYIKFHKFLEKSGFIMMQESVYVKLTLNNSISESVVKNIKDNLPRKGLIQIMKITEKQFQQIECVSGLYKTNKINSEDRLIIL